MQSLTVAILLAAFIGSAAIQPRAPAANVPADAPVDGTVVKPFDFDRQLVVCNAYPSDSPMFVQVNGRDLVAGQPIGFGECRGLDSRVQAGDRLDMILRDEQLQSTFEVDTLPPGDAELVLVPHKRKNSKMIRFQSMAMPVRADGKDAQLALIDTFAGNGTTSMIRMEDHVVQVPTRGKDGKVQWQPSTNTKRVENLNFDRVYSVEAGLYDANMDDTRAKPINLLQDKNYVFIRTGGGQSNFPESLVVFPETPMPPPPVLRSGSRASSSIGVLHMAILAFAGVMLR